MSNFPFSALDNVKMTC